MRRVLPMLVILAVGCSLQVERGLGRGELRGRVVFDGPSGRVAATGATVRLLGPRIAARTDGDGRFVLRGLGAGSVDLRIDADTDGDGEIDAGLVRRGVVLAGGSTPADAALDLGTVVVGAYGDIEGTVVRDGDPVGHAVVAVSGLVHATTGADGSFRLTRVPPGSVDVAVSPTEGGVATRGVDVKARETARTTIDLATSSLVTEANVNGIARIAGSQTHDLTTVSFERGNPNAITAETSVDGAYSAMMQAGIYRVRAHAASGEEAILEGVVLAGDVTLPELLLVAPGACEAEGDVDGDGIDDEDEPEVCRCVPGTVDENRDGVCDAPGATHEPTDGGELPDGGDVPDGGEEQPDGGHVDVPTIDLTLHVGESEIAIDDDGNWTVQLGEHPYFIAGARNFPGAATFSFQYVNGGGATISPTQNSVMVVPQRLGRTDLVVEARSGEFVLTREFSIFTVVNRSASIWFSNSGNDTNPGTRGAPKKSPLTWLSSMNGTQAKRELHMQVTHVDTSTSAFRVSELVGTAPVRLIGGYDEGFYRDNAGSNLTRFEGPGPVISGGVDVTFDGVQLDADADGIACSGSRVGLLNATVVHQGSAISGTDCDVTVIGSLVAARPATSGSTAVALDAASKLIVWHSAIDIPDMASLLSLGHEPSHVDLSWNVFVTRGPSSCLLVPDSLPPQFFNGNVVSPAGGTLFEPGITYVDANTFASPATKLNSACNMGQNVGLSDTWAGSSTPACFVEAPFPAPSDALHRAALENDRYGTPRSHGERAIGPVETWDPDTDGVPSHLDTCPLAFNPMQEETACGKGPLAMNPPAVIHVDVNGTVSFGGALLGAAGPVTWSIQHLGGVPIALPEGDTQPVLRMTYSGTAHVRLTAQDTSTGQTVSRDSLVTAFEQVPQTGRRVFFEEGRPVGGTGTAESPFGTWAEVLALLPSGPVDVIARAGTTKLATALPFPVGLRVFGGHRLDAGWSRRIAASPTTFQSTTQFDLASDAVLDGVTLRGSTQALPTERAGIRVTGPIRVYRSRIEGFGGANSVTMHIQSDGGARFVGNTFRASPSTGQPARIVQLRQSQAAFFFNDFVFDRDASAGQIALEAYGFLQGSEFSSPELIGNRFVNPSFTATHVAIRADELQRLMPMSLAGNGSTSNVVGYQEGTRDSSFFELEGHSSFTDFNWVDAQCAGQSRPDGLAGAAGGNCVGGAVGHVSPLSEFERLDVDGDLRSESAADIGADEVAGGDPPDRGS